jgi:hypothetical protein
MSASPRRCCQRDLLAGVSGGRQRIKAARFSAHKTFDGFEFTFQRSVQKTVIVHLGQPDVLHARENVILLARQARSSAWPSSASS